MAVPFLATLAASARMAYPAIVGGVRRGLSANRIQQILTSSGIGIRRRTLLDIVAREKGIVKGGGYLRDLRRGQRFNPIALPEAITPIKRNFAVTLRVEGTLIESDIPTKQWITLAMDKPMDRPDMEALAMRIAEEGRERYQIEAQSAVIEQGVIAGPAGLL